MEKKKIFESPKATIIEFNNDDIIMTSGPGAVKGQQYDDWGNLISW